MAESAADSAEALDDEDVAANETGDGSTPQEPAKKKAKISDTLLLDWRHLQAQISGQNPGPFRPRHWPVLEVSDDFADAHDEEEHSDAGDGN
ncbi:hypothetical protein RHGRI_033548 [Rhododendron griersonianum]|uniref:Uncharacterized protein n=1 Tax=Rhododendron griersonianum TaxID=479676 RepID=A0AAV6HX80_9ERIC|nr:hypothetical protein RHGRI_033548 [Rhododendron griersonianum]